MSNNNGGFSCTLGCWALAAGAGFLTFVLLLVLGNSGIMQAIFLAGLVFVLLGLLFTWLFCSSLPAMGEAKSGDSKALYAKPAGAADAGHGAGVSGAAAATAAGAGVATAGTAAASSGASAASASGADATASGAAAGSASAADAGAGAAGNDAASKAEASGAAAASATDEAAARTGDTTGDAGAAAASGGAAAGAAGVSAAGGADGASEAARSGDVGASGDAAAGTGAGATSAAATGSATAGEDYDGDGVKEGTDEGKRPEALVGPRGGKADNLKEIKGIGPKLEKLCNTLGFYHFDQIANWTDDEVAWVNANLEGFKGRVSRDEWVKQAKILASGGETEFSKRVEDGDVY